MKTKWGKYKSTKDIEDILKEEVDDERMYKEPSTLEIVDNRIFFYSEIERDKVLQLNRRLREIDNDHISERQTQAKPDLDPIYLHINSFGGSIFDGFSAMDNLLLCKSKIVTVVDGVCASAATFLSVVGKERYITKHSFMLIHQLSSSFWGKYTEVKDEIQNLDIFMEMIKGVYTKYTKIPEKKLEEILQHDLFFNSTQCVKYGLVDKIIE